MDSKEIVASEAGKKMGEAIGKLLIIYPGNTALYFLQSLFGFLIKESIIRKEHEGGIDEFVRLEAMLRDIRLDGREKEKKERKNEEG